MAKEKPGLKLISMSVSSEVQAALAEIAYRDSIPRSRVVHEALRRFLKSAFQKEIGEYPARRKTGNSQKLSSM